MTFKNLLSNLMTKILICVIAFLVVFYIVLIKAEKPSPPNHGVSVQKTITDRASSERTASNDVKKLDKGKAVVENTTYNGEQAPHPEKLSAIRKKLQSKSQIDEMSKAIEDVNKDNEFVSINSLIPKEIISYEYSLSKDLMLSGAVKHGQEIKYFNPTIGDPRIKFTREMRNPCSGACVSIKEYMPCTFVYLSFEILFIRYKIWITCFI